MMCEFIDARMNMVKNQIAPNHVFDQRILDSMLAIPRHEFTPDCYKDIAYLDTRISLGNGRELMKPETLARLIQLASISDADKVLDIACGTGYSTAILCNIAHHVVAIDNDHSILSKAAAHLESLGLYNFTFKASQLLLGAPELGPFQAILINGIISQPSLTNLLSQISKGARLVCIEEIEGIPRAILYQKVGNGSLARTEHFEAYATTL